MAVPQYSMMFRFVLEALNDCKEHHYNDCIAHVAKQMNLSEADCQIMLSNGSKTVLKDRVQWALTHVRAAGLAEITKRGWSRITSEGQRVLADSSIDLNYEYLMRYESFVARFSKGKKSNNNQQQHKPQDVDDKTPNERISDAFGELNKALEEELLDEIIRKQDAKDYGFFESLVVDLVKAMGYGSHLENPGYVIPKLPLKESSFSLPNTLLSSPIPHGIYEIPALLVGQYIGMAIPLRLLQALVIVIIQQIQRAGVLLNHFQYLG